MSSPEAVVYLFHGTDEPTLRDRLTAFLAEYSSSPATDMNFTRLEGRSLELSDIVNAAGTLPFLADVRVVVVDNLTESGQAKELVKDGLAALIAVLPDWARVVFVETGTGSQQGDTQGEGKRKSTRRQLVKKLVSLVERDPRGKVLSFDSPSSDSDRARWVEKRASFYEAAIDRPAAALLANRIGDELTLIDIELMKLATYVNGERAISSQDVELLTPYESEANIFNMVDALGQRNGRVALALLRQMTVEEDQPPLRVFSMMVRQYRLLLQMKEQLEQGRSPHDASKLMGIHNFVAQKLAGQSRNYSLRLLERIYEVLLETDVDIKTGRQDPQLALETLVARLAR
ncbi:MAG: DNA polymerase III subunit delta [Chloroflexi bacterium]|nr:DNA polymerase III subunit delta [Chloroflexota bacterium]